MVPLIYRVVVLKYTKVQQRMSDLDMVLGQVASPKRLTRPTGRPERQGWSDSQLMALQHMINIIQRPLTETDLESAHFDSDIHEKSSIESSWIIYSL